MHDLTRAIGLLDRHGVESDPVGQVLLARVNC